jgi:Ni/Fe-hydrogenase 1 B-type cytochrome subunit
MTTATSPAVEPKLTRVYVWDVPVRLTHWLIAISITVLAITGFYIGHPFIVAPNPAGQEFVMGRVLAIHFFAAIVFSLSEISRIIWMFVGNRYARWDQMIPMSKVRWKHTWEWLKFYLLFRAESLFSLQAGPDSPMRIFSFLVPLFGGAQTTRWIHHNIMWLLVIFVIHHISCALLVTRAARNATIESMFSGYRFARDEDIAAEEEETRR